MIDNSECCTPEQQDACDITYEYKPTQDKCFQTQGETTTEATEGKEDCCHEGWNTDNAALKEACDIAKKIYKNNEGVCTLTLLDILPHLNDEKTTTVDVQDCIDNANGDEALMVVPQTHLVYSDEEVTWDEALSRC